MLRQKRNQNARQLKETPAVQGTTDGSLAGSADPRDERWIRELRNQFPNVRMPKVRLEKCEDPTFRLKDASEALSRGLELVITHHGASAEVVKELKDQVGYYLSYRIPWNQHCLTIEKIWLSRAKFLLCYPLAEYLKNDLPPSPDHAFRPLGVLRKWMLPRLRSFNRRNTHLWSSWLQAKRSCLPLSKYMVCDQYLDHRNSLTSPDTGDKNEISEILNHPLFRYSLQQVNSGISTNLRDYSERIPTYDASTNACFSKTRSGGGQSASLRETACKDFLSEGKDVEERRKEERRDFNGDDDAFQDYLEKANPGRGLAMFQCPMSYELDRVVWSPYILDKRYIRANYTFCVYGEYGSREFREFFTRNRNLSLCDGEGFDNSRPLKCSVQAVQEPLKTRMISKGETIPYYSSKPFQKALHGCLRDFPCFSLIGRTLRVGDLTDIQIQHGNCFNRQVFDPLIKDYSWFSVDYKAATDGLSWEYSQKIFAELIGHLPLEYQMNCWRTLSPHKLIYPSKFQFEYYRNELFAFRSGSPKDQENPYRRYTLEDLETSCCPKFLNEGIHCLDPVHCLPCMDLMSGQGIHNNPALPVKVSPSTIKISVSEHRVEHNIRDDLVRAFPNRWGLPELEDPEGSVLSDALQTNGQLMGSNLSFPILCLANLGVYIRVMDVHIRESVAYLLASRNTPSVGFPGLWDYESLNDAVWLEGYTLSSPRALQIAFELVNNSVRINGDDMVYAGPTYLWSKHCLTSNNVGLQMSLGKAYCHPSYLNINSMSVHCSPFCDGDMKECHIPFLNSGLYFGQRKVLSKGELEPLLGPDEVRDKFPVNQIKIDLACEHSKDLRNGLVGNIPLLLDGALPSRRNEILASYLSLHAEGITQETRIILYEPKGGGRRGYNRFISNRNIFLPMSSGGMGIQPPEGWRFKIRPLDRKIAFSEYFKYPRSNVTFQYPLPGFVPEVALTRADRPYNKPSSPEVMDVQDWPVVYLAEKKLSKLITRLGVYPFVHNSSVMLL